LLAFRFLAWAVQNLNKMKNLETITKIKEKLNKGEKLNCSETHILINYINSKEEYNSIYNKINDNLLEKIIHLSRHQ